MTPEQHVAFTRRLGPLHVMEPLDMNLPGHPGGVRRLQRDQRRQADRAEAGRGRASTPTARTSGSRTPARSCMQSRCRRSGATRCSSTCMRSTRRCPTTMRRRLVGRRARFSRIALHHVHYPLLPALTEEQKAGAAGRVITRCCAGTRAAAGPSLYIGRWACDIEGMDPAEGRALIAELQDFAQQDAVHLPPGLAGGRCRVVGQPLHPALRHRLRRR